MTRHIDNDAVRALYCVNKKTVMRISALLLADKLSVLCSFYTEKSSPSEEYSLQLLLCEPSRGISGMKSGSAILE